MKRLVISSCMLFLLGLANCTNQPSPQPESVEPALPSEENAKAMHSFISIFEIPATDLNRAVNFYQTILNIQIETMEIPGMTMGVFPYEDEAVTGLIIQGEGYLPSADGSIVYLNAGEDLQPVLDKVEAHGGTIIVPRTAHADGNGSFAIFLDTEGNKMGLSALN